MKKLPLILFSILFITVTGCSSEDIDPKDKKLPKNEQYAVYLTINRENPDGIDRALSYPGAVKEITAQREDSDKLGYGGVLMYNDTNRKLYAYDLACPNCWAGNLLTRMEMPGAKYECKECKYSAYLDIGGSSSPSGSNYIRLVKYEIIQLDATSRNRYLVTNPDNK